MYIACRADFCPRCCDACHHFGWDVNDPRTREEQEAAPDCGGFCLLHKRSTDYLDDCLDFLCISAVHQGVGYRSHISGTPRTQDEVRFQVGERGIAPVILEVGNN